MKRIIAFALAVLMIYTTACSSTPKANKLPLGEDMVNQIISDSKLPVIAEKIDVANDVQGITAEYYNLKDGFSKNPMGSFSTVTGNNGVCVDLSSWSIIGDFFAVALDKTCIDYKRGNYEFVGVHAGLTEEEMTVPFIAIETKKRSKK